MTNEELIKKIKSYPVDKSKYMAQLYNQNRGFIYKTALQYSKTAEIDDLMQEAYIVLDEAVHNYKSDINIKFITYFGKILKWRLSAYSFGASVPIKMPSEFKELIRRYYQFKQDYFQQHGKKPDESEYMRALTISQKTLECLKIAITGLNTVSFDDPLKDADGLSLEETIPADEDIECKIAETKEKEYYQSCLYKAIDKLCPQKKKAITDFYFENKSFSDTAKDLNVSVNYVYTLRTNAVRDLRRDWRLRKAIMKEEHYDDSVSYRYSAGCFKSSGLSSVEVVAIRNEREKKCC